MMGALATSAAKRYNLKYRHIGHLFQGPYRYNLVDPNSLWYVAAYVHLNPVRAGLAKQPEDWAYSNYREIAEAAEAAEGFLPARYDPKEGNLQPTAGNLPPSTDIWRGYPAYVKKIMENDASDGDLL